MFEWFRQRARDKFADLVLHQIAAAGGPTDWIYDKTQFAIKRPDTIGNLAPTYMAYQQAKGEHRKLVLTNFVSAFIASSAAKPLTWDEAQSKLIMVVRERTLLEGAKSMWAIESRVAKTVSVSEPFSAWFSRALVLDSPGHVTWVTEQNLTAWNITLTEAFSTGLDNLRASTAPKFEASGPIFVGKWQDDYDSSRILVPGLFDDLALKGDPVVCLPTRLSLLVAGSDDVAGLRFLFKRAEEIVSSDAKPQNAAPLVIRDGVVLDFDVSESSPVYQELQRARGLTANMNYEEQKVRLEQLYKEAGKDIFIGKYTFTQSKAGEYSSYSVWSRGVDTLLPVTDYVMFFDGDKPEAERLVARAPWTRVCAVVGDLMLDTKMFPIRHYVSKFPTPDQLTAMSG